MILSPALISGATSDVKLMEQKWPFNGIFGRFDESSLQRGFQVYREVCAACHGIRHISYRDLEGIGYTNDEIKVIAADYEIVDGPNDEGEMFDREALPSADYLYSLLNGYKDYPENFEASEGMYYNEFYPGYQIAMPSPLMDDIIEYSDGTEATQEQIAKDVTSFLAWTAEPELEERKSLGVKTLFFLILLTIMLLGVKRKIWKDVE